MKDEFEVTNQYDTYDVGGTQMKTVKDLRKFLDGLEDDMPIIHLNSNDELEQFLVEGAHVKVGTFRAEARVIQNNYAYYQKLIYVPDDNGIKCLLIK